MLIWIDTETTGLVATKERVLEVAAVVTDDALNEVARFERVTNEARFVNFDLVDPYVVEMHFTNGLWRESMMQENVFRSSLDCVDKDLVNFIMEHAHVERSITTNDGSVKRIMDKPQLAGSTISFDRAFMDVHLPRSAASVHYRNVDVSSFNEVAKRFWPSVFEGRPRGGGTRHRAMDDILDSLAVMRYYISHLGPRFFGGEGNPNP